MTDISKKIRLARSHMVMDQPWFGHMACSLDLVEDRGCKTFFTDGKVIGFNPAYAETLTEGETQGVVAHEVMHVANLHHAREGKRNHKKWNIATDYAINGELIRNTFKLPAGTLYNPFFDNMSAEGIYDIIDGGMDGVPDDLRKQIEDAMADPDDAWMVGEVGPPTDKNGDPLTGAALKAEEARIMKGVEQAASIAQKQGKLPGSIKKLIHDTIDSTTDWKDAIRLQLSASETPTDYDWGRPNRRHIWQGIYLPSTRKENMEHIVLAVDTSGSVDEVSLRKFMGEMVAIHRDIRPHKLTVMQCDTRVIPDSVKTFTPDEDPVVKHIYGRGGTSFRPVFKHLEDQGIVPSALIYFTDLACSDSIVDPGYPVIWAAWTSRDKGNKFGEVIRIK
jgi:predicted metal-dependent peptidase